MSMNAEKPEDFIDLMKKIENSPGQKVMIEVERLKRSLRMVKRNKKELVEILEILEQPVVAVKLRDAKRHDDLRLTMEEVGRMLLNFLASVFSLKDYTKELRNRMYSKAEFSREIESQVKARFKSDDDHIIAKGLRNYIMHFDLAPVSSKLEYARGMPDFKVAYELPVDLLLEWEDWDPEQREALNRMGKALHVAQFVERYFQKVESFYIWLWKRQATIHKKELDEVNELKRKAQVIVGKAEVVVSQ